MTVIYSVQVDLADDGSFVTVGDTVTGQVCDLEWRLGFDKVFDSMCGESWARITLQNINQAFSPELASGMRPGYQVRIVTDDGVTQRVMWLGFIDEIRPSVGLLQRLTTITARMWDREMVANVVRLAVAFNQTANQLISDLLASCQFRFMGLSRYLVTDTAGSLTDIQWAAPDFFPTFTTDTGVTTFPYSGEAWAGGVSAWEGVKQVVESERGHFFFSRDGQPNFYNRHHLFPDLILDATISGVMREAEYWYGVMSNYLRLTYEARVIGSPLSVLVTHPSSIRLGSGITKTITLVFRDALNHGQGALTVVDLVPGTDFTVNALSDGSGAGFVARGVAMIVESSLSAVVIQLTNFYAYTVYVRGLQVRGTPIVISPPAVLESKNYASITACGLRLEPINLPVFSSDDEVSDLAAFELARRSAVGGHMRRLTLDRRTHEAQVLQRTLFDRIRVSDAQTGHDSEYWILSEEHHVTSSQHVTKYLLEPAITNAFLTDISLTDGTAVTVY